MPVLLQAKQQPEGRIYLDTMDFQAFSEGGKVIGTWRMGPPGLLSEDEYYSLCSEQTNPLVKVAFRFVEDADWAVQDCAVDVESAWRVQLEGEVFWWVNGNIRHQQVAPDFDLPNPAWRMPPLA